MYKPPTIIWESSSGRQTSDICISTFRLICCLIYLDSSGFFCVLSFLSYLNISYSTRNMIVLICAEHMQPISKQMWISCIALTCALLDSVYLI